MGILLSSGKRDFVLEPTWTNVTGLLGFSDESLSTIDLSRLGAFVTNPISLHPRSPAHFPRVLLFPGGFLLHTGHPNPGLSAILQRHERRWAELPCPVIVHLLGQDPDEISAMVEQIEEIEAVAAIEVGLEATVPETISQLTHAATQSEVPIIIQVPLDCSEELALAIAHAGAHAISLGPPRGSLPGPSGEIISGRLFGPALFPMALQAVVKLSNLVDIPILASGGIYNSNQVRTMLAAGASAVQLDSVLWTEPERILGADFAMAQNHQIPPKPNQAY
jgi:dihydroorotate dehydrogenase (NAD+) catalytic subunit